MPKQYGKTTTRKPDRLVALVEGHEEKAVKNLLVRWLELCNLTGSWEVVVIPAKTIIITENDIAKMVYTYVLPKCPTAILILRDNDGDCQKYKGQGGMANVLYKAATEAIHKEKLAVVISDYCIETWLYAGEEELSAANITPTGYHHDIDASSTNEGYCGQFKSALERILRRKYSETQDAPNLAQHLPLDPKKKRKAIELMIKRAPSYGKFIRVLEELTGHALVSGSGIILRGERENG